MKAVVVKINGKQAQVLLENGRFVAVKREEGMAQGMQVTIRRDKLRTFTRLFDRAACFAAFVFAMMFLAFCIRIMFFH